MRIAPDSNIVWLSCLKTGIFEKGEIFLKDVEKQKLERFKDASTNKNKV